MESCAEKEAKELKEKHNFQFNKKKSSKDASSGVDVEAVKISGWQEQITSVSTSY